MRSAQILELLLEYGPEISRDDLGLVVEIGSTRIVEKLVNDGANVNPNTKEATTPLEIAALHYDPDMVRLLLDFGAKVTEHTLSNVFSKNVQGMGRKGDMNNTVKILLDRSQVGIQRALPKAIGNGSVEAVKAMISKGVKFGEPELELAARWEHIEVVKLLVMNGVKTDSLRIPMFLVEENPDIRKETFQKALRARETVKLDQDEFGQLLRQKIAELASLPTLSEL
ncbi:MAG: hypothetical protein GOMPHAMPRED_007300 [Gomphillus americanus]|uniref:Ankyrin repeat domain-containing protein n=1 Tax=Gomphillus americanus TaxID=1940652 RepID=A0A8H3ERX6_9LECA|nr:MAG: hypothetical protein GOMPHAMPRED_007300 [Gomphillus americanus]